MWKTIIISAIYALISSLGWVFVKAGLKDNFRITIENEVVNIGFNRILILGLFFYFFSFFFSMYALRQINLSIFYPLSIGFGNICIILLAQLYLNEKITITQIIGIFIVMVGAVVMNIGKVS